MRIQSLAIALTLVAVTSLVGCGETPVDPRSESTPMLKPGGGGGGGGSGASSFDVIFLATSGWDIETSPAIIPGQAGVGNNSSQIETGGAGRDHRFRMSSTFLANVADWETCFGVQDDGTAMGGFSGDMKPAKRGNGVTTTCYFNRLGTDGSAIGYVLTLNGTADGSFPPAVGETVLVSFSDGEVEASSGGRGKKGSSGGSACGGTVVLSPGSGVSVEATG